MLIACWSVKGGSGTTVVATSLALLLSRRASAGALIVDLGRDVASVLAVPEPAGPGAAEWSVAADVGPPALERLITPVGPRLGLIGRGPGHLDGARLATGLASLATPERPVIADLGVVDTGVAGLEVAAEATMSLLVLRPCYLALRRAIRAPIRPSAVILVDEPDRVLSPSDVADTLGVPIRAIVPIESGIARAVDAGLLSARLPRALSRALRDAA